MLALSNHPKIQEILNSESIDHKLYFTYRSSFNQYIQIHVRQALLEGKSLLLTVDSTTDVQDLVTVLDSFHQYVYVHKSYDIPLQSISNLRVRFKKKSSYLNYLEFENLQNEVKKLTDDIQTAYSSSYNNENHSFSLTKLLKSQRTDVTNIQVPILEYYIPPYLFEGSTTELHYLTEIIQWASNSYDHTFKAFSESSWFGSYEAQQYTDESFVELRQHLAKSNELVILFLNNLNEYKASDASYKQDDCKKSNELLTQLDGIHRKMLKVEQLLSDTEGNLLSKWSSKLKSNNTKSIYSENIEIEYDQWLIRFNEHFPALYQQYAMLEESTLKPNLLIAQNLLKNKILHLETTDKRLNGTFIEQLNIHNCPKIFKDIINELTTFYMEVSSSGLVHMPVSDNSFNIINSFDYLLSVRNKINDIIILKDQQAQYFTWIKRFQQCSNLEKTILHTLITFFPDKDEWVTIFSDYYHYALSKSLLIQPTDMSKHIAKLDMISVKLKALFAETITQKNKEKLDDYSRQLKTKDLGVYKTLFKKKYDSSELNLTTNEQLKLIQNLFPITIVDKSKWLDLNLVQENWDLHLHVDSSKFETEDHKIKTIANTRIIIKHPIDEFKLKDRLQQSNTSLIKLDCAENIKHPKVRTDQDQLNFSRSLSTKLDKFLHRIQIFQLGNKYVISFLDKRIILNFLEINSQHTIKKFVLDHDLNYSLSDILLVGTDHITIMVQDHLLDPHDYPSFQWQRYLISLMSRAGIQIRDVSMKSIFDKDYSDLFIPLDIDKPQCDATNLNEKAIPTHI